MNYHCILVEVRFDWYVKHIFTTKIIWNQEKERRKIIQENIFVDNTVH